MGSCGQALSSSERRACAGKAEGYQAQAKCQRPGSHEGQQSDCRGVSALAGDLASRWLAEARMHKGCKGQQVQDGNRSQHEDHFGVPGGERAVDHQPEAAKAGQGRNPAQGKNGEDEEGKDDGRLSACTGKRRQVCLPVSVQQHAGGEPGCQLGGAVTGKEEHAA